MHIDLDTRSRAILHHVVDTYIETGEPVGSKTISSRIGMSLSPATIRNVMADLADAGFLYSPHTSAGRLPTDVGLRFFIHGLLELGSLSSSEKLAIESRCREQNLNQAHVLEEATSILSGLSQCAGLVIAPKTDQSLKHVEFVRLAPERALLVTVSDDDTIENRVIEVPLGMPVERLTEATNYINAHLKGRTLDEVRALIESDILEHRAQLDDLFVKVVEAGLATWSSTRSELMVRGQSNLLKDVTHVEELDKLRHLFAILEEREGLAHLVDAAISAEGVQIFIGGESDYFRVAGCSVIVAPYLNTHNKIIGAIGVVGPSRINYGKIIPMVDFTAQVVTRLFHSRSLSLTTI